MKNIMLIAVATLTIATANATNWQPISSVQIVNNTNVTLEFRTEPGNDYFTVPAGTTESGPNSGSYGTYIGWGINSSTNIPPVWEETFDDSQAIIGGTMSTNTSTFYGNIYLGQVWAVGGIGYNDTLVITGTASGNMMQLTLTRKRGVMVHRADGANSSSADVFCLNKGVEFNLNTGDSVRCPAGETQVLMGRDGDISHYPLDSWTAAVLIQDIYSNCIYNVGCTPNPGFLDSIGIQGGYMTGFDSVPYSSINSQINIAN